MSTFNERMEGVFSWDEAIPVLNEYLASIQIDDDEPGFLFNWNTVNLTAFVNAVNAQLPADAPGWMQTRPPNVTTDTFIDELVRELAGVAGGRCGHVLLAPNSVPQAFNITRRLLRIEGEAFMQNVAHVAFNNVQRPLARTYNLTTTEAQQATPNNFVLENEWQLFE